MFKKDKVTSSFLIDSKTISVREVAKKIKVFCDGLNISDSVIEDIVISADEAFTNIILHGYEGCGNCEIEVFCSFYYDKMNDYRVFEIAFYDSGKIFKAPTFVYLNKQKKSEWRKDKIIKGGYGLIIMHKFMDFIKYSHDKKNDKNILVMKKYL